MLFVVHVLYFSIQKIFSFFGSSYVWSLGCMKKYQSQAVYKQGAIWYDFQTVFFFEENANERWVLLYKVQRGRSGLNRSVIRMSYPYNMISGDHSNKVGMLAGSFGFTLSHVTHIISDDLCEMGKFLPPLGCSPLFDSV